MTPILAQRPRVDRSFERLYRRHVGDVYRYTLAVLRNAPDAEDVTQTTFMNAYRAFQRGERPDNPHNWLIAIAHNVCRQRFRQSARRPQEVAFDDDVADRIDDEPGPSAEDIRRALGHLAFNQRAALVMRELEGRSYAEIGEILGVSVSAVETLIFRARRALREQLSGSLTCGEAELAISRQLDGRLTRADKGQLRAHLRECGDCATFARRQRAQRAALRSLVAVPLPGSLTSFFGGGGGAAVAGGMAAKVAAVAAAGAVVAGGSYEVANHVVPSKPSHTSAASSKGHGPGHAKGRGPTHERSLGGAHGQGRGSAVHERAKGRGGSHPGAGHERSASKGHDKALPAAATAGAHAPKEARAAKIERKARPAHARGQAGTGARTTPRPKPAGGHVTRPKPAGARQGKARGKQGVDAGKKTHVRHAAPRSPGREHPRKSK